ncbi:MAG: response regulator [Candidatus Micrarchaeota archaeon]
MGDQRSKPITVGVLSATAPQNARRASVSTNFSRNSRVLLVDDDKNYLWMAKRVLNHWGYTPTTASSGESALELIKKNPFALILTDFKMPGMNGAELVRTVKKDLKLSVPCVICSKGSSEELLSDPFFAEFFRKGIFSSNYFTPKMFPPSNLKSYLEKLVPLIESRAP